MSARSGHWEPGASAPVVCGAGALNGLGLDAQQTYAFWRAELSPFVESPFLSASGERATFCSVRTLPLRCTGAERLHRLFSAALDQLRPVLATLPPGTRGGMSLALPERFGGAPAFQLQRRRLEERVTADLAGLWPKAALRVHPAGNAGFAAALLEAAAAVHAGHADVMLVGGVESFHDPTAVELLLEEERLFDGTDPTVPIPGEGAAMLLLARGELARSARLAAMARIDSVAVDAEPPATAEQPNVGLALSRVLRTLTQRLKRERRVLDWVLADVTGEEWRTREWTLAFPRSLGPGGLDTAGADYFAVAAPRLQLDLLPSQFGDLGAATLPTAAILACEAFRRRGTSARTVILSAASQGDMRGAVLLSSTEAAR